MGAMRLQDGEKGEDCYCGGGEASEAAGRAGMGQYHP